MSVVGAGGRGRPPTLRMACSVAVPFDAAVTVTAADALGRSQVETVAVEAEIVS